MIISLKPKMAKGLSLPIVHGNIKIKEEVYVSSHVLYKCKTVLLY